VLQRAAGLIFIERSELAEKELIALYGQKII